MNNILSVLMFMVVCIILYVITDVSNNTETKAAAEPKSKRITIKEDNYPYDIIEVDSVEYLINNQGGVYPLIKK